MGRVAAKRIHQRDGARSRRAIRRAQVIVFPWYNTVHVDMQVQIDVYRFETDAQGIATLSAKWTILDSTGKNILYTVEIESDATVQARRQ